MTAQPEAPPTALEWLRSTFEDLRGDLGGLQKQITSLRMRTAALESELELRDKREAELRGQLREADTVLDTTYEEVRAGLRADYLSDLVQLADRCNALAKVLALVASRGSAGSGPDALAQLGAPEDVVALVRSMAFGDQPRELSEQRYVERADGLRHSPEPSFAEQMRSAPHPPNHVVFASPYKDAKEREGWERQSDIDSRGRTSSVQEVVTGTPATTSHRGRSS